MSVRRPKSEKVTKYGPKLYLSKWVIIGKKIVILLFKKCKFIIMLNANNVNEF
jgi:hypothetical protein